MKKISNLGKVLSRDEAKKIIGGDYDPSTNCESNADCPSKTKTCSDGESFTATGSCYYEPNASNKTCHYGGCPS